MKINYALRESEYVEFVSDVSMNYFKKYKKWFIGIIVVLLLLNCAYVRNWSDLISTLLPWIILVSLWIFIMRSGRAASHVLKNEQQRQLILGNQSVELLDDKIILTTESAITQFNWKSVKELKEGNMCIYLSINQVSYIIIPKRVFKNDLELAYFKQIVERNMSN